MDLALDSASLVLADGRTLQAEEIQEIANAYLTSMAIRLRLGARLFPEVLDAFTNLPRLHGPALDSMDEVCAWMLQLEIELNRGDEMTGEFEVTVQARDSGGFAARIRTIQHGVEADRMIGDETFRSPEYRQLLQHAEILYAVDGAPIVAARGERSTTVATVRQALEWMLNDSRRGVMVQRYKGLGEMNPDQLWDTTMNPLTRRLLQVRIEDAVSADNLFTTLMGDQVEPRREFIETNALSVSHLDA